MRALVLAVVILGLPVAAHAGTVVTFDNGVEGWVGPAGPGGATTLEATGGNPGANLRTVFNNFGITFANSSNADFVGDYTQSPSVTLAIDLRVHDISFFGTPAPRPWLVELRDFDNPPGGFPWVSVWYKFADVSQATHGDWTHFEITIDDTSAAALPPGWGGYGAEGPLGEPMLPANRTFTDVLDGIDEIAFTTLEPGFFFGFTDFDVRIDNIALHAVTPGPTTWFVNDDADGANDGTSWDDAFLELQSALAVAAAGDEIWVAAGTYLPDYDVESGVHTGDRESAFRLVSGVGLYGGFDGTESSLAERAGLFDATILSGDLLGDDGPQFSNRMDNSHHVVAATDTATGTVISGFTIRGGNALTDPLNNEGGGLVMTDAALVVDKCHLSDNEAAVGGALSAEAGQLTLQHCRMTACRALARGGALSTVACVLVVTDSRFESNDAGDGGGAAAVFAAMSQWQDCHFTSNRADNAGGAVVIITPGEEDTTFERCSFLRNHSDANGGGLSMRMGPLDVRWTSFLGNTATSGGGAALELGATAHIFDGAFSGNRADQHGGAIAGDGGPLAIDRTRFVGNMATDGGAIAMLDGDGTVSNALFIGNDATRGGAVYPLVDDLALVNSTFIHNVADEGSVLFNPNTTLPYPQANLILYENGDMPLSSPDLLNFTLVFPGPGGTITADPLFMRNPSDGGDGYGDDPATALIDEGANDDLGDLRLQPGSPAIDAGNNQYPGIAELLVDIRGFPRRVDDPAVADTGNGDSPLVDLGAYERAPLPLSCLGGDVASCCDVLPADGIRDDRCAWCACDDSDSCQTIDLAVFGDVGGPFGECLPDQAASIHDRTHVIRCFEGNASCDVLNLDVGGPGAQCAPDGECDLHDVMHTLNSFANTSVCTCPPAPVAAEPPGSAGVVRLQCRGPTRVRPGQNFDIEVVLDAPVSTLQAYQLAWAITGGRSGHLELVDLTLAPRKDWALWDGQGVFTATNIDTGRLFAGADDAVAKPPRYLATATFRASRRATGAFVIDLDPRRTTAIAGPHSLYEVLASPMVVHVEQP